MAGFKESESIPHHRPSIQTFESHIGKRSVKIVDTHGVLDPNDIHPNGEKIMKRVKKVGNRIVTEPVSLLEGRFIKSKK